MTGGSAGPGPGPGATLEQVARPPSRSVVLLRMSLSSRLPVAPAEDLARIAGVARGLAPGELLAVRSHAPIAPGEAGGGHGAEDLRALACTFAPDDHEVFVWRPPPEAPPAAGAAVAGELRLDVRALSPRIALVAAVAALAALRPGEVLVQVNDGPPLLLLDLLAGRAVRKDVEYADEGVVARIERR